MSELPILSELARSETPVPPMGNNNDDDDALPETLDTMTPVLKTMVEKMVECHPDLVRATLVKLESSPNPLPPASADTPAPESAAPIKVSRPPSPTEEPERKPAIYVLGWGEPIYAFCYLPGSPAVGMFTNGDGRESFKIAYAEDWIR